MNDQSNAVRPDVGTVLPGLRPDEVPEWLVKTAPAADRMPGLFGAVLDVVSGLQLETTLRRIVEAAVEVIDARCGSLAVLAPNGDVSRFVNAGLDDRGRSGSVPTRGFLAVPIWVGDRLHSNLHLSEKADGGPFTADDEVVAQTLAAVAGIAVHNAEQFEQGRIRRLLLEASAEILGELLSGATDQDALQLIAQRAQELTGSAAAVIMLVPDPSGRFELGARSGAAVGLDEDSTPIREVLESRAPVLAEAAVGLPGDPDRHQRRPGPAVAVPVCRDEGVTGVFVAVRSPGAEAFSPAVIPLLRSFADQATLVLEVGEKSRAQRQVAVLAERDRIARDMHDHIIQRLFATGLGLQSALSRTQLPDVHDHVRHAVAELDEIVREVRAAIFDLHPSDPPERAERG
ncbi:GAF domain-containing protein [Pseudonocardia asaccharolytica]|uniref:GAF domain-containing protein n=1 Tax=Pseudonocardia asaccharolytica DSM 44247 = NBRC 16224 TaxID=1123024 RepID=A0A511D6F9_9PSEU|nr:GAF domain-containing protein [Pseudonocardia asaccharolytica]GEL20371.1 hypothetical protein PA7_42080 [Pseudonocardia asaccharolytica DSM 44247 = NBRC 16224]